MPRKPEVVSHWHKLFENFTTSSREFYAAVEVAILKRGVPDLTFSRVTWMESGILSAKREYLRVARGRLHWDICAAPFGTGFFFSSRLALLPRRLAGFVYLLLFSVISYFFLRYYETYDHYDSVFLIRMWFTLGHDVRIVAALFLVLGVLVRMRVCGDEDAVLAMPVVGFFYEKIFNPETYFKEDTDLMFKEAVEAAMQEAVLAATTGRMSTLLAEAPQSISPEGDEEWGEEAPFAV